jgi:hypothetical protein
MMRAHVIRSMVVLGLVIVAWSSLQANCWADSPSVPTANRKVLEYARTHKGEQVGDGICRTLVIKALEYAHAEPPRHQDGLYTCGRRLKPEERVRPGDIALFKETHFPGSYEEHHIGIVFRVKGSEFVLLHQNFGGKKYVLTSTYDRKKQQGGQLVFFRPKLQQKRVQLNTVPAPALKRAS